MKSKTIVLPGGGGFLGKSAANFFKEIGFKVVILTRGKAKIENGIEFVNWDGKTEGDWIKQIDNALAVINFTGKSVNCIYSKENKREIIESRTDSVRIITDVILKSEHPPEVFIQAGSLAIYGDTEKLCDEQAKLGNGFSVEVCKLWEKEFFRRDLPRTRKVFLRIGFVLGKNGGALEPLMKLTRYFLGGTIGSGKQYISWLHLNDLNRIIEFAIKNELTNGIYNATGETPVTNKVFMKTLRKVMKKIWSPPAPAIMVKIGAYLFMRADPSLALTGRNCIPKRLIDQGFKFDYSDLELTLNELVKN